MDKDTNAKYDEAPAYGDEPGRALEGHRSPSDGIAEVDNADSLQRHLGNRQIQLIAIGGAIGTGLFVSIGSGLEKGGPGSLLVAYIMQSIAVALVTNGLAEMTVFLPISGSFIRFAGAWVDEAWGFMIGWNLFFYEAFLIPFEISALCLVLSFWRDDIPAAAVCAVATVLYGLLNVVAVKFYGEAEFWLASGKVLLFMIFFMFTWVTMAGGNPQNHAYGFEHWHEPAAFKTYITDGNIGRLHGFLGALGSAFFTVVGPEYLSIVAGEAQRPRTYLKAGFKSVYWRFGLFFIGGSLTVGCVVSSGAPELGNSDGTANGSPYVIAMQLMGIKVLPHIVNALLCTTLFSAGNAYTYCAARCLYGLALQGQAPKIFTKCLSNGIPIYCFAVVMIFPLISFLQVSGSTAKVISVLQSLTSGAGLINYLVISVTFICFHRACKAQGVDRRTFPYYGYFQPYAAYFGAVYMFIMIFIFGYTVFLPGHWNTLDFFSYYTMLGVGVITFCGWKFIKGTRFVRPQDADLVWDRPIIDAYEASLDTPPERIRDGLKNIFRSEKKSASSSDEESR